MASWLIGDFTCPRCGSHVWSMNPNTGAGQCDGYVITADKAGAKCSFTWSREKEDHLYINPDPLAKVFTSQE